jgi:hypothetical protein
MKPNLVAFGAGSLFAVGLTVSGMTKPSKVTGFLDVAGRWDPSLGLVMAGALAVSFIAHRLIRRRAAPIFDVKFHLPTRKDIDWRLVVGATLFGVGWGLGGFCPGPGLVAGAGGVTAAIVFVGGMTIGMLIEHAVARGIAHGARHRSAELHHLDNNFGEQP